MDQPITLSRRAFLQRASLATAALALAACGSQAAAPAAEVVEAVEAPVTTPDAALARLMEGNGRYVAAKLTRPHQSMLRRTELATGQQPFASIFGCVNSRVAPELLFDRGLGDLFVIRSAAHVLDNAELGSLEFGVAELKIPLLVVLGHEKCGAVKATIETVEQHGTAPDQIDMLVKAIAPAVEQAKAQGGDLLDASVRANVALTVERLRATPLLAEAIKAGTLKIVGGRYDLDTGTVEITVS